MNKNAQLQTADQTLKGAVIGDLWDGEKFTTPNGATE